MYLDYDGSEGIRKLAEEAGYNFHNVSIDVSGRSESEIEKIIRDAKIIGRDINNPALVLRDGDKLAVFGKKI